LDGVLDLITCAARPRPIEVTLAALAESIATLVGTPICSIYLREDALPAPVDQAAGPDRGPEDLVLRANVGFPPGAVGRVRLAPGEGITGFAVECLRPVSVATAAGDPRNKPFVGIGEEKYPVFLAIPLLGDGPPVGALVLQRSERAFTPAEVTLVAALAAPVVHAVALARSRAEAASEGRTGPVRLAGTPCGPGSAVGTVALARSAAPRPLRGGVIDVERERERARTALDETARALQPLAAPLPQVATLLGDVRVSERVLELIGEGCGAAQALDAVAREAARMAVRATDEALRARALDLEALCDRAAARALELPGRTFMPGTVLVASRVSSWDVLELAAAGGVGVALALGVEQSPGASLFAPLGLAASAGLPALYHWTRAGARILVNGDTGEVVINPGRAEVATYRLARSDRDARR
jgi:phosphotransferase system enzyme I (PtsP)